ncbi:MAG TPA: hypothetical protein VMT18_15585 [Planctomycetota bacterium]|nr:hypothetical protein [Planctomycetota bacterium]
MRTLSCLGLAALLTACSTPRFDVTPRWGTFDIDGDLGIASGGVTAKADLNTAGLQQDDSVLGARVDFDWGPSHLMVSGQQSEHGGDGTLDATLSSGGITIGATTPVASELDLGLYSAAYTFDFVPSDLIEVGLGVGVSYLDVKARFTDSTDPTQTIDADESLPVPVLAARLGTRIWRIDASLQAQGIAVELDGDEILFVDLDLMAKLHLLGGADHLGGHLTAGYRWVDLELEYENDDGEQVDGDATFSGPYIGLTLSI